MADTNNDLKDGASKPSPAKEEKGLTCEEILSGDDPAACSPPPAAVEKSPVKLEEAKEEMDPPEAAASDIEKPTKRQKVVDVNQSGPSAPLIEDAFDKLKTRIDGMLAQDATALW